MINKTLGLLAVYIAAASCSVQNSAISYGGITSDKQNKQIYETSKKYSYNFYLADTAEMRKYKDYSNNNFISSEGLDPEHSRARLKVFGDKRIVLEGAYIQRDTVSKKDTVFIDQIVDSNGDGKLEYRILNYSTHRDTVDKDGVKCDMIFWGSKQIEITESDKKNYATIYGRVNPVLDIAAGFAKAGKKDYKKFSKESYRQMLSIDRKRLDEWKKSHKERR